MKLDKRFILCASFIVGIGIGIAACEDDKEENTCGNNQLDAGEVCDKVDGTSVFSDASQNVCSSWQAGEYEEGGQVGCAKDCKGFAKGTCVILGEGNVNGVKNCGSNLSVDADNKIAKATVSVTLLNASDKAKGAIVCTSKNATAIEGDINLSELKDLDSEISLDLSSKGAGEYLCYVIVSTSDKNKSVVCPLTDARPVKATGAVASLEGSTVAYNVAASADDIAVWNDFSAVTAENLQAGMNANVGSDTNAKIKVVVASEFSENAANGINKGQNASNETKALVIGNIWPAEKPATAKASSHLLISSDQMAGKKIVIKATTGAKNNADVGHMAVVAGDSELVADFHAAKTNWQEATATIPAGANEIVIYSWGMVNESNPTNLIIDSISISNAAE